MKKIQKSTVKTKVPAPKLAFLGSPEFAVLILKELIKNQWIPEIIITEAPKAVGRKKILTPTAVEKFARRNNLPFATPNSAQAIRSLLTNRDLNLAIMAAYGKIIPEDVLKIPTFGIVNIHASLLPKYRGASPIQAAIANGDKKTGISFMLVEKTVDTGPVLAQFEQRIDLRATTPTLTQKLAQLAASKIVRVSRLYLQSKITPRVQGGVKISYAPKLKKEDGEVRLLKDDPRQLDRKLRAFQPWPGVYSLEFGKRLIIRQARYERDKLKLYRLQWEGKTVITGKAFKSNHPDILTKLQKNDILLSVS